MAFWTSRSREVGDVQRCEPLAYDRFQPRLDLLERDRDIGGVDLLALQLLDHAVDLVECGGCLASRAALRQESPHRQLNCVDRRPILAALRQVGEALRKLLQRPRHTRGVTAGNDDRTLVAESAGHHLDESVTGCERLDASRRQLVTVHEVGDQRMIETDDHQRRLAPGLIDLIRGATERQGDSCRLQTEARVQVDRSIHTRTGGAQHRIDAVGNHVVVAVSEQALGVEQRRQVEVILAPRPRTRWGGTRRSLRLNAWDLHSDRGSV